MKLKKINITYPFSRQDKDSADVYFGTTIQDPYRWLEDDQSAETKDWVAKQNIVTNGYLSQIPLRAQIQKRLEKIWNFEKFGVPFKKNEHFYFFKNDGLQNQSVLYQQKELNSQALPILDPNKFSKDGTASLQEFAFSNDGRYMAYSISTGGSDWRSIRVKDLLTGDLLPDVVEWAKFTVVAWQDSGFYYSRYPAPVAGDALTAQNERCEICYHKLGTPQADDVVVYKDPAHPKHYFNAATTDDERFLYLITSKSTSGNTLAFKDLQKGDSEFTAIEKGFDYEFQVIDNIGDQLLVLTSFNAPNQQLVLIDTKRPARQHWQYLIPEDTKDVLRKAVVCGDKIVCEYLHNASSALRIFDLQGHFKKEIPLPEIGTVADISGTSEDTLAFFSFQSFLRPSTIYNLDTKTLEYEVFQAPRIDFNPDLYLTEQIWYKSKDGTQVPMFITRRKDFVPSGNTPTLLYGYGGFNISVTPSFSASKAALLENNGIYVVANIRGGGEFGEAWHKSGTLFKKQNVFDDFIAAAEYLIEHKYTSPARLAIEGGSNGGLLIGACMTQRPELFGVCFPRVGVLDMLRYQYFTIGYAWAIDYGRSDESKKMFEYLRGYSPLHNIKKTNYPSTMITTADHDDRVVPAHSFKFAATLQAHQQGEHPVLIRIDTSAGHGAGKPTSKLLEEAADMLAFMLYQMQ